MELVATFLLGFWAGMALCRYGVSLIARDYPPYKALALFRRDMK